MAQLVDFDVRDAVLADGSFGPQEINKIVNAVGQDPARLAVFRDAVVELDRRESHTPASAVRLGVCQYLLGRYSQAIQTLATGDGGALAHYYQALAYRSLADYARSVTS